MERVWRHWHKEKTIADGAVQTTEVCNASIAFGSPPNACWSGRTPNPLSKIAQRKERDTIRKRNRTITIRCTDDEYERIHNKAQRHKLSLSNFVLSSALDKKIVVADGLNEVAKQQKAIGRNLNQIAMLAHEGRLHSVRLDVLIEQHKAVTQAVCDIAKEVR